MEKLFFYHQQKENDLSSDDEAAPRVMACSLGPENPQTTFVMLDSSGEVQDVLYTGSLTLRSQNANDQQRKMNDQEHVLKFMTDHQPHVIVLGAANLSCTRLKEDIYEVISWFYVHIYILENFLLGMLISVYLCSNFNHVTKHGNDIDKLSVLFPFSYSLRSVPFNLCFTQS
jgi:hypothetical protein